MKCKICSNKLITSDTDIEDICNNCCDKLNINDNNFFTQKGYISKYFFKT